MPNRTINAGGISKPTHRWHPRPRSGIAQLSLVEHALCALDPAISLVAGYRNETGFFYTDGDKRRFAKVSISAPLGLSSRDEYFLWGLLALTFNQPQPSIEFLATPHFCLRKLGCLDDKWGGKNYADFRATIKRLAGIYYQCDAFYDPRLGTFQDAGFGFLKYSLPQRDDSSRAWRIVWDPMFFEYVRATGGKLFFDLTSKTFRDLDPASRRLALLLHKIFWRRKQSPSFEVRHLAVHILGFSPTIDTKRLKYKISSCAERLLDSGIITLQSPAAGVRGLFEKRGTGQFSIRFHRGPYFDQDSVDRLAHHPLAGMLDSPLYDPLKAIGFEDAAIRSIIAKYDHQIIARWVQYTQAAMETKQARFFKKSPQAYCLDGIKRGTSAPDWFLEQQRNEEYHRHEQELRDRGTATDESKLVSAYRTAKHNAFRRFVQEDIGRERYQKTVDTFLEIFKNDPPHIARDQAINEAERHLASGFQFPEYGQWSVGTFKSHGNESAAN